MGKHWVSSAGKFGKEVSRALEADHMKPTRKDLSEEHLFYSKWPNCLADPYQKPSTKSAKAVAWRVE